MKKRELKLNKMGQLTLATATATIKIQKKIAKSIMKSLEPLSDAWGKWEEIKCDNMDEED